MKNFSWMNKSEVRATENGLTITATPNSNSFVDPVTGAAYMNAPFYYQEIDGDFVIRAKVSLEFLTTYDACVLFAYANDQLWAKACFESTDFGTHAVVSVMTDQYSDDANCINVDGNQVWLQLSRKEDVFAVHYSLDGEKFIMARLARLPMPKQIKAGMAAQSPIGQGGDRNFEFISVEHRTLADIRAGK
jgi:regulation of enolase protein 1 (concanavalin A-like superfamily)